jgi:hypothetical protein
MAHVTQKQGIVAAVQDTWDRTVMKVSNVPYVNSVLLLDYHFAE